MRRKRRTGRRLDWIAVALAVAAAAVGAAAMALPRIVEGLLIDRLDAAGFPDPDLRVTDLGWSRATIADLALGTDRALTADAVVLTYAPLDLLRGRLEAIRVRGLTLTLRLDGDGPLLGSLADPLAALADRTGGEAGATVLPDIRIAKGAIALAMSTGRIAVPIAGEITQGPDGVLEGDATLLAENLAAAGFAAGRLAGRLDFTLPPGGRPRLSAHLRVGDITATGAALDAGSLDIALDGNHGTARLRIEEPDGRLALGARASFRDPYGTPEGTIEIDARAAAGSALWRVLGMPVPARDHLELAATLRGRLSPAARSFAVDRAKAMLTGLAPAGIALDAVTIDGAASGTPDDFAGTFTFAAAAPELAAEAVRGRDLTLTADAMFSFADGRLTARLRGGEIGAQRLAAPGLPAVEGPVRLPLAAVEGPTLAVDFTAAAGPRLAYDLTVGPATLNARLRPTAPRPVRIKTELSALSLAGSWTAARGGGGPVDFRLAAALAHRRDPAFIAPVNLEADSRLADGRLDFTARASPAAAKRVVLAAEGHHDLRSGAGAARIDLRPIAFGPDGPAPADLAPVLAGRIEQATGTAALAGTVSWTQGGSDADLGLLLRDLSFVTPQATVTRLNAVIAFDDLLPLSTPPGQQLAVAAIDAGLPLTDGLATFRIGPGERLAIDSGRLRLASGTVSVEPAVLDFAAARNVLRLRASDVALTELAALADVDGLSATGRLDGDIPVRLGEGVVIENGVLAADGPGRLSYAPARPPTALQAQGETVSLLLSALTNFRYEELRLTVDREAGGEMNVAIHIEGKNPDFYDGYPVELNFNISGKLDQVLHRGLVGYRIPDAIRERLSEFPE